MKPVGGESQVQDGRCRAMGLAVEVALMAGETSGAAPEGPGREDLERAFQVFMEKAAELEASHGLLQSKVDQLTQELAVKVREVGALRDHLSNVLESVADAVVAVDGDGLVTSFNRAAEELFGRPEERCRGRSLREAGPLAEPLSGLVEQLLGGGERRRSEEREVTGPDGKQAVLLLSVAPLRDASGRLAGAVASAQDVTQLRELERTLARKERLAALGEMAAVLAHEIRNPLGGIQLYAGILARTESLSAEELQVVAKLSSGVTGLNKLVEDMLAFAREIVADRAMQDVRLPLEGALEQASSELEAKSAIVEKVGWERPLSAAVDNDLLRRAVLNLLLNAAEAIEPGGRVRVECRLETAGGRRYLVIRVCDDGKGLSPEEIEQVFNPFYTTKAKGTGLGLAVVSRIVAAHGGEVRVENRETGGACFAIRVPAEE
ncbi:MAG: two-component system sensor histidine kinase NtrB [Planctomycetota bacterium]